MRSWELLSAFCGVFYPTDDFVPYLASYLMQVTAPLSLSLFVSLTYL